MDADADRDPGAARIFRYVVRLDRGGSSNPCASLGEWLAAWVPGVHGEPIDRAKRLR